jgi:hypothetical protein
MKRPTESQAISNIRYQAQAWRLTDGDYIRAIRLNRVAQRSAEQNTGRRKRRAVLEPENLKVAI